MQFLRSVGGTMGVAVMFTIIQGTYHRGVDSQVPEAVSSQPALAQTLDDPQFLLNARALTQLEGAFQSFGADGQALFDQTLFAVKASLADGITDAFLVSALVLSFAVVVAFFMKEVPLRRTHAVEAPPAERAPVAAGRPAEGAVVGMDQAHPQ
jgi:hypothetical protein